MIEVPSPVLSALAPRSCSGWRPTRLSRRGACHCTHEFGWGQTSPTTCDKILHSFPHQEKRRRHSHRRACCPLPRRGVCSRRASMSLSQGEGCVRRFGQASPPRGCSWLLVRMSPTPAASIKSKTTTTRGMWLTSLTGHHPAKFARGVVKSASVHPIRTACQKPSAGRNTQCGDFRAWIYARTTKRFSQLLPRG